MVTIGAFAGLRSSEIARLDWKEVRLDAGVVEVTAGKSKTASRRLVPISPNLRAWLARHTPKVGPIVPPNARKLFDAARRRAKLLDNWPDNGLRHSFASYRLAQTQKRKSTGSVRRKSAGSCGVQKKARLIEFRT
jgi:integrase